VLRLSFYWQKIPLLLHGTYLCSKYTKIQSGSVNDQMELWGAETELKTRVCVELIMIVELRQGWKCFCFMWRPRPRETNCVVQKMLSSYKIFARAVTWLLRHYRLRGNGSINKRTIVRQRAVFYEVVPRLCNRTRPPVSDSYNTLILVKRVCTTPKSRETEI
jgi:hypothetical protein